MSVPGSWLPLREAWDRALYGPVGFYRGAWPADHFRTSVLAGRMFADALLTLVHRLGATTVVDVGAGRGELLTHLRAGDPDLRLIAVELRPRPAQLPESIEWRADLPRRVDGLVLANEVVDNISCDVVELDADATPRIVEVEVSTGAERLGPAASPDAVAWLDRWWPLQQPGERAEVGSARERWWAEVVDRLSYGACLAIDYGHTRAQRPPLGSVASFRAGRSVPVGYLGDRDVTADVAVDALTAAVGGSLRRQSEWLADLGLDGRRPPVSLANSQPAAYVRALSRAGEVAELTAPGGLGDFWWLLTTAGVDDPFGMGA